MKVLLYVLLLLLAFAGLIYAYKLCTNYDLLAGVFLILNINAANEIIKYLRGEK